MAESSANSGPESRLLDRMPPEAVSFFAVFSRFEYALKKAGLLKRKLTTRPYRAEPSWKTFSETLGTPFLDHIRKSGSATTILEAPPKKQMVVGKKVEWQDAKPVQTVADLFDAVCQVRNNLFHGGKFCGTFNPEASRDERLLHEAKWILEQALNSDSQIAAHFNEHLS